MCSRMELQKRAMVESRRKASAQEEEKRDARSVSVYLPPESIVVPPFMAGYKSKVMKKVSMRHKHNVSFDEPIGPRLVHKTVGLPHA
ncbi:MAG: hypothetical protein P4M11_12945 [Candidatus Pacebacteria bacterium]|nr:hypothetical protein [Candidatus Paceibacterota bacterium]